MTFTKAVKEQNKLRMALIGPSGSGKTYSALSIATHMGGRIALIDTERGSASKYADLFDFDVLELSSFSPNAYIAAIDEASKAGYTVLIIDSLSHAWAGKDGVLEFVDKKAKATNSGNTFAAWRDATPLHNSLIDAMLGADLHIIATMRSKMEHVQDKDDRTGKTVIRKVGMQPIQRDGLEYEFDVVGDLNQENDLIISKTRCPAIGGVIFSKPGKDIATELMTWLTSGVVAKQKPSATPQTIGSMAKDKAGISELPTQSVSMATPTQRGMIHARAKEWWTETDPEVALHEWLSNKCRVESTADLTKAQASTLIEGFGKWIAERDAAVNTDPAGADGTDL